MKVKAALIAAATAGSLLFAGHAGATTKCESLAGKGSVCVSSSTSKPSAKLKLQLPPLNVCVVADAGC